MGPTKFDPAIVRQILKRLSAGESLRAICREEGMPSEAAVRRWAISKPKFGAQYTRARDLGLDAMADEMIEIADQCLEGKKTKSKLCPTCEGAGLAEVANEPVACQTCKGKGTILETLTGDMVDRARLMVDTRKWYLSKLAAKRYGDKLEHAFDEKKPLQIIVRRLDKPNAEGSVVG